MFSNSYVSNILKEEISLLVQRCILFLELNLKLLRRFSTYTFK